MLQSLEWQLKVRGEELTAAQQQLGLLEQRKQDEMATMRHTIQVRHMITQFI